MKPPPRLMIVLLMAVVLSAVTYAFASANTFDQTEYRLGDGNKDISGYAISSVHFNLNATDPSMLDTVTFTINPANAVSVKVNLGSGGWKTCTNSAGSVICPNTGTLGITAASATNLHVIAKGD